MTWMYLLLRNARTIHAQCTGALSWRRDQVWCPLHIWQLPETQGMPPECVFCPLLNAVSVLTLPFSSGNRADSVIVTVQLRTEL